METLLTYFLYWLDGKVEKIEGVSIENAFVKAGYGGGAINALDFYQTGRQDYEWKDGKWELTEEAKKLVEEKAYDKS